MTSELVLPSKDKAFALVQRIGEITCRLTAALSQEEGMSNYRVDSAIKERTKIVQDIKLKCTAIARELEAEMDKLNDARRRLGEVNQARMRVEEENKALRGSVECDSGIDSLSLKKSEEIRYNLKLYKAMTGVHFDMNAPQTDLTGFVAIKGDANQHSTLVPFMLEKDQSNINGQLWSKFGEALYSSTRTSLQETVTNQGKKEYMQVQ